MPIIAAIASLPTAKPSPNEQLVAAKIAYASKLKITYKRNPDGSLMLKSIRGITEKDFKKLSDGELKALGLYRESKRLTTKYWEINNDDLVGKAIASTEPRENLADKRFTSMAAAAYYRGKSGQPLKVRVYQEIIDPLIRI